MSQTQAAQWSPSTERVAVVVPSSWVSLKAAAKAGSS
jgi:hypothetical protein